MDAIRVTFEYGKLPDGEQGVAVRIVWTSPVVPEKHVVAYIGIEDFLAKAEAVRLYHERRTSSGSSASW